MRITVNEPFAVPLPADDLRLLEERHFQMEEAEAEAGKARGRHEVAFGDIAQRLAPLEVKKENEERTYCHYQARLSGDRKYIIYIVREKV